MLYIKDYRALEAPVYKNSNPSPGGWQLQALIGKRIRVYVEGGEPGNHFTGILTELFPDRIKLVTSLPSEPVARHNGPCRRPCGSKFGTAAQIVLSHIVAVEYNEI